MALNLTNLVYSEKDIGATLKISKRQFIWEFDLNGSSQHIELLDSRFSRKKRLYKNGVNILDTTETGNFIHNFEIDGHPCVIIQYGDKIELRIDNQSFTHLYNLQKNKELFAGEKGPTSNIYVANSFNGNSSEEKHTEDAFYKVNKPEEENKPKLFNFEIKKNTGNKTSGGFNKFKFGGNKEQTNSKINNQININNNSNKNGNVDLLGIQNNQNSNINNTNNNNNLLDFSENNNMNNQNPQNKGNNMFNLLGNSDNNQQNNINNNNQFNNIFLQITDGTNQQPTFDQNNLGFLNFNNNGNNNNMQQPQQQNQNNNGQNNSQNNGNNIDFLKFD
jgi:hypothetical protein